MLSTIFEARIRKRGIKVGKMAGVEEKLIRSQNAQILILVRFIGTTSANQATNPGVEETCLFHRKLPLPFGGSGFKRESLNV